MKENENKKSVVRVTEGDPKETTDVLQNSTENKMEKLKKPLIFGLMGIVFVGCLYLIFKPSDDKNEKEAIGFNDAVPQATGAGLPDNKSKAYEMQMREQKEQEKRHALLSLSDYWHTEEPIDELSEENESYGYYENSPNTNSALNSYQEMQHTLGTFYQDDYSETTELRKQLKELQKQLAEKDEIAPDPVETQLALMEKSYEMAAKYLPNSSNDNSLEAEQGKNTISNEVNNTDGQFVAFNPAKQDIVSALYREPTDSAFIADWSQTRNRNFYTVGSSEELVQPKNSVKACVHEEQTVIGEAGVRLRLMEAARTPTFTIPQGTIVTALAKFQGGRLQLKITSMELDGNIIPVDISIYDLDGQEGLYVPFSAEMNALTEMAGNMSQTSGTSVMLTQNAGQQVAADLSRGVVQGISGYFSKKVRTPKVTLKAGHQVLLVSKQ